jgi:hypothetical protein
MTELDKHEKEIILYLLSEFLKDRMKRKKRHKFPVDYDWTIGEINDICNKLERG